MTAEFPTGSQLGNYHIVRLLGRGGMGEVYEAEHTVLRRRYALKVLPGHFASNPGALERFQREAEVMANLEHPHILRVDDFGESNGWYWLRMELAKDVSAAAYNVLGEAPIRSLQDLAEALNGRLPQELMLHLVLCILDGLGYAHARGAVHRDLKPSNILLFPNQTSPENRKPFLPSALNQTHQTF